MARRQKPTEAPHLVGGPYAAPKVAQGDWLYDEVVHERRQVVGFTDAPVRWPKTETPGYEPLIVCFDLTLALHQESSVAVQYWFGATESMVNRWRKALNVSRHNRGTAALYRERYADKAPVMRDGKLRAGNVLRGEKISPEQIVALRKDLGLSQSELAAKLWVGVATIQAWEQGRRSPGGPEKRLIGLLLEGKI